MSEKLLPCSEAKIQEIAAEFGTPFHLYDEGGIRKTAQSLKAAYDWAPGYVNHFAVKATPNPYILAILKEEGMGADASSLPELILAEAVGIRGEAIMFTSNNTPPEEYRKAYELGAVINLDDINEVESLQAALDARFPDLISFRYNPGPDLVTAEDNVIGNPSDAKFGVASDQIVAAYKLAQEKGATRFGLHTMVVSNERSVEAHVQTARMIFETALKLKQELGIEVEFINLGGGLGVAYDPKDEPLDLAALKLALEDVYEEVLVKNGLDGVRIVSENGRYVLGPNGILVTKVRSTKETYHSNAGLDATMADLMRPGMYDAYHHVTVLDAAGRPTKLQRATGSLCENNDIFTGSEDRELPEMKVGDLVVIHDTGAHGHAMGFNYNGKLRHAELLLKTDGSVVEIRRAETIADYFKTLDYPGLKTA